MTVGWSFDLRTAVLFGAMVILLTAALLLLSWRSLRGNVRPSLRWWLAALLLHPGEVFEVVQGLAVVVVQLAQVVGGGAGQRRGLGDDLPNHTE